MHEATIAGSLNSGQTNSTEQGIVISSLTKIITRTYRYLVQGVDPQRAGKARQRGRRFLPASRDATDAFDRVHSYLRDH
jgi:hypothetical protein